MTSASLWNYYRDKVNDDANDVVMMLVIIRYITKRVNILSIGHK